MRTRTLVKVPAKARRGEVVEIKVLVSHPMETGFRRDRTGGAIPVDIIRRFECRYDGDTVFAADFHPAVAANPFLAFTTVATTSGTITFEWVGDNGFAHRESAEIQVE